MHACIHAYQVVVVPVSHEQHAYALGVVERLRLALPHLQVSLSLSFSPSLPPPFLAPSSRPASL